MLRLRRRDDSWENPAWPGLVDLFAFGMVIMLTLWVGASALKPDVSKLQQQLADAIAKVTALEREVARLQAELGGGDGTIEGVLKAMLEQEIRAIRVDLRSVLGPDWDTDQADAEGRARLVIKEFEGKSVVFATGRAELTPEDAERLRAFTAKLSHVLAGHPASRILINGTADPQPMTQPNHPKDNTELSALRAAAVARVLTESGGVDAKRLQVTGLGETGQTAPRGLSAQARDEYYGRFRTVTLEIQVDLERLAASRKPSQHGGAGEVDGKEEGKERARGTK